MQILFLTDNFPPEANAPAARTHAHCREWARKGARVTVITCAPNFPQGRVYEGHSNRPYQVEEVDGIRVVRVWSYIAANAGFAKRIADYVSFAGSAFVAGLFQAADVIVATSPQLFTTVGAMALSVARRKPWVFELRDLWPDSIRAVSAMSHPRVLDGLEALEKFLYRRADLIVAVSPAFKTNLVSRGIDASKIEIVTNGADLEMFTPRAADPELTAELGIDGKLVVGYVGTHGMAHNLEAIVGAAHRLDDGNTVLLLIGDGARKQAVAEIVRSAGARNVLLLDPVPKEQIARYWSVIDVALVPLRRDPVFTTVIPSKIFEAAAMGKPILLGVDGQAREIVEGHDIGVRYEPDNMDDFVAKVELLRSDRALYQRLADNGPRMAKQFDRKELAARMYGYLEELVRQHQPS